MESNVSPSGVQESNGVGLGVLDVLDVLDELGIVVVVDTI